jgi:hypothetical protein
MIMVSTITAKGVLPNVKHVKMKQNVPHAYKMICLFLLVRLKELQVFL